MGSVDVIEIRPVKAVDAVVDGPDPDATAAVLEQHRRGGLAIRGKIPDVFGRAALVVFCQLRPVADPKTAVAGRGDADRGATERHERLESSIAIDSDLGDFLAGATFGEPDVSMDIFGQRTDRSIRHTVPFREMDD